MDSFARTREREMVLEHGQAEPSASFPAVHRELCFDRFFGRNVSFSSCRCSLGFSRASRSSAFVSPLTGAVSIFWDRESTLSPTRLLLAPSLAGLIIAVLVIHSFPWRGERSQSDQSSSVHLQRLYSPSYGGRQVHYGRAGHWVRTLLGAGRSVSANRCQLGFGTWTAHCTYREIVCG